MKYVLSLMRLAQDIDNRQPVRRTRLVSPEDREHAHSQLEVLAKIYNWLIPAASAMRRR